MSRYFGNVVLRRRREHLEDKLYLTCWIDSILSPRWSCARHVFIISALQTVRFFCILFPSFSVLWLSKWNIWKTVKSSFRRIDNTIVCGNIGNWTMSISISEDSFWLIGLIKSFLVPEVNYISWFGLNKMIKPFQAF